MFLLEVKHLGKHYPSFDLQDVSFSLESGRIMGFIGRNGAGKTTTLKCLYNLVSPTSGSLLYQGQEIRSIEAKAKSEIGLLFGEVEYYPNKRLSAMSAVTKTFYPGWDDALYQRYLADFGLDESKKIKELSSGMKVKYGLAIALSHGAKVLLLDEPTSGLDPVSRDELLDIFLNIVSDGEHAILFSTHVISDLEKCADDITYIQKGRILVSEPVRDFEHAYAYYSGEEEKIAACKDRFIHVRSHGGRFEAVALSENAPEIPEVAKRQATLEEIMIALERGNEE
jgi:ABC-2 type transport system ATP-binding protein